jgi:LacI family transcriptional regulator
LNYRPNLAARAPVTRRTRAIGLNVPDLVHPFFGQVAKALSGVLRGKGYCLALSWSDDEPNLEQQEIEQLLARVDASPEPSQAGLATAQTGGASFNAENEKP